MEVRASPRDWIEVLKSIYPFLVNEGISNLVLFGSQAMSFYMKNPLRSKDLDLVTDQLGPKIFGELAKHLTGARPAGAEFRTTNVQTRPFDGRTMTTYSVEMQISKRPFILEIFDAVLDGRSPSVLTEHVQEETKWGVRLWVPTREAVVALRLCFRQPEGISRLNATRLNGFIRDNKTKIRHRKVGEIVVSWGKADLVRANLQQLKQYRQKITDQEKFLTAIKMAEQKPHSTTGYAKTNAT
jgi:hypothetical protein